MKKIIILSIPIILILYLNININLNIKNNIKFLENYNYLFNEENLVDDMNLPKIEFNNSDYIGIINIQNNLIIPIQSNCNNSFISINSLCLYKDLVILGTNLKDSFNNYKKYDINDTLTFTNMLGNTIKYKIKKITRINNLNKINNYNEDLIIVIKNYYSLEYILFICEKS